MEEVESSYRSEMMDGEGWKMIQPNTNKQLVQIKTRSSSMQVVKEEIEEEEVAGGRGRRRGGLRRSVSGRGYNSSNQKVIANANTNRDTNNLAMQTQVPTHTREGPTFTQLLLGEEDFDLPPYVPDDAKESNQFYQQTTNEFLNMNQLDNNGTGTAQLESREHMMTYGLSSGISSQLLGSQAIDVVDVVGCLTSPWGTQLHEGHLAHLMSYIRACRDLEQHTPPNFVMHQSIGPVLNHYALSAEMSYSMRYPENAVTRGPQNILGFLKNADTHTQRETHTETHVHTTERHTNTCTHTQTQTHACTHTQTHVYM
uniref:Uncharacterized protein n=1 Tax=Oryza glumipatula TaxID=40148 RepID=A0A0E0BMH1_9ORYZ